MPKAKKTRQANHWCFTIYDREWCYDGQDENMRYMVAQEEVCPETRNVHWQGYAEFYQKVSGLACRRSLRPYDTDFHNEERQGSRDQARAYCMDPEKERPEDSYFPGPQEFGFWIKGPGGRSDLKRVIHEQNDGMTVKQIAEQYGETYIRNFRGISMRAMHVAKKPEWRKLEVSVHYGPKGTGKSHTAMLTGAYVVNLETKFWTDYDGEDAILLDDFKGQYDIHWTKRLLDKYPLRLDTKHGAPTWARWTKVYITSNHHPSEWWPTAKFADVEAILDRISVLYHHTRARDRITGVLLDGLPEEPIIPEVDNRT